jgi:hypothetical protein
MQLHRHGMTGGVCRVPSCSQHGLFFKRLDRHLKRVHFGINKEEHGKLPSPDSQKRNIKPKSSSDRHIRRACRVPSCRYFNVLVSRLSDHLQRRHGLTVEEHNLLYNIWQDTCEQERAKDNPPRYLTENHNKNMDLMNTLPGACCPWLGIAGFKLYRIIALKL